MAERPRYVEAPVSEALLRDDRALPLSPFALHSLPIEVEFPAAGMRRDIEHGLRAIPDGVVVVSQTQPVLVVDMHLWTSEIAYLQMVDGPGRARVIFVATVEAVQSSLAAGNGDVWVPAPIPGGGAPAAHAPTHSQGGTDPVTVTNLAGYPGGTTLFLRADKTFAAPAAGVPGPHATTHEPGGADVMAVDAVPATGSLRTLGSGPNQAAAGNDTRLTNARTPVAHAGSHNTGGGDPISALSAVVISSANLSIARMPIITPSQLIGRRSGGAGGAAEAVTLGAGLSMTTGAVLDTVGGGAPGAHASTHQPGGADPMAVDAAAATGSLRTLGSGANQAAPGNDARFAAPSTPTAHHTTHEPGGSDPISALSGAVITTGTVADARLSSNVVLKDRANTLTKDYAVGAHALSLAAPLPLVSLIETVAAADNRLWRMYANAGVLTFAATNDAESSNQGTVGIARNGSIAVGGSVYERGRTGAMGDWIAFTPVLSGSGWTMDAGDDQGCAYMRVGRTLWMNVNLASTSVAAGGTELYISLPEPTMLVLRQARQPIQWSEGGATQGSLGWCLSLAGDWYVHLTKLNYAPWGITTNATEIHFVFCVELQT